MSTQDTDDLRPRSGVALQAQVSLKPRYRDQCNHCGECCRLQLCPAAERLTHMAPCPFLSTENLCGLVLAEEIMGGDQFLRRALGVGCGCSMPDAETTEAEIIAFDLVCMAALKG